jgi:hypothetical protein
VLPEFTPRKRCVARHLLKIFDDVCDHLDLADAKIEDGFLDDVDWCAEGCDWKSPLKRERAESWSSNFSLSPTPLRRPNTLKRELQQNRAAVSATPFAESSS